jgi:DNA polymerase II small subunit
MDNKIVNFCIENKILIEKNILETFNEFNNPELFKDLIEKIKYKYKKNLINKSFFYKNNNIELISLYKGENKKLIVSFFKKIGLNYDSIEQTNFSEIKKLKSNLNIIKIYENNPKKLEVSDFVNNFRNRFNFIKNLFQARNNMENLISINRINNEKSFILIGLVYDKKQTKNGNIILEIEDLTGRVSALVNKEKPEIFEKTKEILLDEVIALKCNASKSSMVFVNDIMFPDSYISEIKKSKEDISIAFISDLHVGSKLFLENNFLNFISWINGEIGNEEQKKQALKIKYLFIVGDSIDGVGIFPGQEKELLLKDVREQYKKLGELLFKIRDDIEIILCPGQHDAVRVAEPQPVIPIFYAESLYLLKNLQFTTNPSLIEVGSDVKFKILMYHGASMHGIINSIDFLRTEKRHDYPTEVVKYMLKKRHLAPTHSLVSYIPYEKEDPLLIKDIPDIVLTGDLHRPEVGFYNGILLISSSCWQARTPFEEKVGNNPEPCKVPVFNMKTREVKILDFSGDLDKDEN